MKKLISIILFISYGVLANSQHTVTGIFEGMVDNEQVKLFGFNGFETYVIDSVEVSERGVFVLYYGSNDFGMAYLSDKDNNSFSLILNGEAIELKGGNLASKASVQIVNSDENLLFDQYASEHLRREQTLSAWVYLDKIYSLDSLFSVQDEPRLAIEKEKQRIKAEDHAFLTSLPIDSYVYWYLPLRKLVSSVPTIAQYRTEEIPDAIAAFRSMDYTEPRLQKSGILNQLIDSHFWLIENSGRSLDSMYIEMQVSIDVLMDNLMADDQKFNEITGYLFKLLERRSLYQASEYLALKVLNAEVCTLDDDLSKQMEGYRSMKIGNTAPDIIFKEDFLGPGYRAKKLPKKLSDLQNPYILVVFAASWCPQCPAELSTIMRSYQKWNDHGVEVIFVSLDEDQETFRNFSSIFPFISICDYKKWDGPIVSDYYVFATPTYFLLDNKLEILLRPHSATQMDAWVDWFLVQKRKQIGKTEQ